jgi:hypothetical protein
MIGVLSPKSVLSEEPKLWFPGDTLVAMMLCRTEEAIMEIVGADITGREEVMQKMYDMQLANQCARVPQPLSFLVDSIIVHYIDFMGEESVVLSLKPPSPNDEIKFIVYGIALGRQGTEQEKQEMEKEFLKKNSF